MSGMGTNSNKGRDLDTIFVECYVGNLRVIDLDVLIREFNLPKTGSKDSKVARCIRFYKNLQRVATRTRFVNAVKQLLSARGINVDIESFRATMMPVYAGEQNGDNNNSSFAYSSSGGAQRANSANINAAINSSNFNTSHGVVPHHYSSTSAQQFRHQQPQSTITMYTGASIANRTSGISVPPAPGIQPSLLITLAELGGVAVQTSRRHGFQPAPLTSTPTSHMTSPAFYSPLEQITAACRLSSVSVPVNNSFHGCLLVFRLPDEAVELLSTSPQELSENSSDNSPSTFDLGSQYKLLLRFKATEPATFEADARPENLFIKVNDRLVYHPEHIHQTKKRSEKGLLFRPIELTVDIHGVNILSLEEDNILSISYSPDIPRDYDFTLWVGKKRSVRDLRMLLDERQPSLQMCKQRVIEMLRPLAASRKPDDDDDDDDIAVIDVPEVRLSLKCPVSKTRLVTPCRGKHCQHIQAFDGDTFLTMNERRPTWRCFVCDKIIWFEDLYCDSYVRQLACSYSDADALDLLLDVNAAKQQPDSDEADVLRIVPHNGDAAGDHTMSGSHQKLDSTSNALSSVSDTEHSYVDAGKSSSQSAAAKRKIVDIIEVLSDSDDDSPDNKRPSSQVLLSDSAAAESSANGSEMSSNVALSNAEIGKRSSGVAELDNNGSPNKRLHRLGASQVAEQGQSDWRRLTGTASNVQPTSLLQLMNGCGSHNNEAGNRVQIKLESVSTAQPSTDYPSNRSGMPAGLVAAPPTALATPAVRLAQHSTLMLPNGVNSPRRHSAANRDVSQNPSNNPSSLIEWFVSGSSSGLRPNQTPAPDHPLASAVPSSPTHSQRSGSFSHFGGTSVPVTYDVISSSFVPLSTASTAVDSNNNNAPVERPHSSIYTRSNLAANAVTAANGSDGIRKSAVDGLMNGNSRSRRIANSMQRGRDTTNAAVSAHSEPLLPVTTTSFVHQQLQPHSLAAAASDHNGVGAVSPDPCNTDWSALLTQALLSSLCNQAQQQQQPLFQYAAYPNTGFSFGNIAAQQNINQYQQQQQQYADSLQFLRNVQAIMNLSTPNKPDAAALSVPGVGMGEQENNSPAQQLLSVPQHHLYDGGTLSNGSAARNDEGEVISSGTRSDSASALLNNYLLSLLQQQQPAPVSDPAAASSTPLQLASTATTPTNH